MGSLAGGSIYPKTFFSTFFLLVPSDRPQSWSALPGKRLQSRNHTEVPISGRQRQFVLTSQGCNPDVIVRDERTCLNEFRFELAVLLRRVFVRQQKNAASQKFVDLSERSLSVPCSLHAIVEFAQHDPWQE